MERVFQSLSETDFLSLSVPELAARFGCSRRHLTRLFHQFFGSSIAEFRMELRLMKVASLLRNPNVKIINIAEQCGFNQLGHFNSCFKRRFGVSPARWRKQLPKEREALVGDPAVGGMSMGSFMRRAPRSKALPLLLPVPDSHGLRPSDLKMPPPDPALLVATSTPASESFELIESLGS
jgi:AraC-like DNA-binding protein